MELNFKLTEKEAEIVINALAKEPFIKVVDVINKVQVQAKEQLESIKE